jgi:hypothetical protein
VFSVSVRVDGVAARLAAARQDQRIWRGAQRSEVHVGPVESRDDRHRREPAKIRLTGVGADRRNHEVV